MWFSFLENKAFILLPWSRHIFVCDPAPVRAAVGAAFLVGPGFAGMVFFEEDELMVYGTLF